MARHIGLGVEEQGNGKLQNGASALKEAEKGKRAMALEKKQKKADKESKK